jgi:transglutaminase-like putative cysteine protease
LKLLKTAHALASKKLDFSSSFWLGEKNFGYDGENVDAGHAWLQFYDRGRWRDYETTNDLVSREGKIDFVSIDDLIPDYQVLDYTSCTPASWITYKSGGLKDETDIFFSFNTGIEARHLYYYVKNEILYRYVTTNK